ncbi:hypothetical protein GIB67_021346 [Kingdonia uniflora]|uniref:Uncharacterized protein n=1 Tax=Kingdonia uniflora TaxID=39325 RepID=A0A7J7MCR1_9MAGN|nr:hypothetical protein GIB67_021346 [Kingdonia uniflora]
MPKDKRDRSASSDRSRASPYHCSSSYSIHSLAENPLEDVKEWEEARCPVCMEHPHNAVLLLCSSREKGCRPYMCDTSYRHSNCLDQFRKSTTAETSSSPTEAPSTPLLSSETSTEIDLLEQTTMEDDVQPMTTATPITMTVPCEIEVQSKLLCPLCRGQVDGWVVVDQARRFMNTKARSCACETCEYNGTYTDLRKHARTEHPLVRPTVADPERQNAWRRLERERDLGDVLSTMRSVFREERAHADGIFASSDEGSEDGHLLTVFILYRVFRPGTSNSSSGSGGGWSGFSRFRALSGTSASRSRSQRRSVRLWGETYDPDTPTTTSAARDEDNHDSSDGAPGPHQPHNNERSRL